MEVLKVENMKMKEKQKSKILSDEKLRRIKDIATNVFGKIGSENYRQKLVYNLLNVAKGNNQKEFFWTLLRALNSQKDDEAKKMVKELRDIYPLTFGDFEKLAYSVIMGIMSAKSKGGD